MKKVYVVMLLLIVFCVLGSVFAGSAKASFLSNNPVVKLVRGVTNLITSWVEIPKQTVVATQEAPSPFAFTGGLIRGIGMFVGRTAYGVFDTATFLVPPYDANLMENEYVFDGWED